MEFGKRHDTADTTGFCWRQLVADWLGTCRLCWGLFVAVLLYVETGVMDFGLNTRCLLADLSLGLYYYTHSVVTLILRLRHWYVDYYVWKITESYVL